MATGPQKVTVAHDASYFLVYFTIDVFCSLGSLLLGFEFGSGSHVGLLLCPDWIVRQRVLSHRG